jgi:hypothetical protein
MQTKTELNVDELRSNYQQLLNRQVPERARGASYGRISGPFGLAFLFLVFFVCPVLVIFFRQAENRLLIVGVSVLMSFLFLVLPFQYYDRATRTVGYVKKHFPQIYKKFQAIRDRRTGEVMNPSMPILKIDGKICFMGYYAVQQPVGRVVNVQITGYAMTDEQGEWLADEELFKKVFLTYDFGLLGAVSGQDTSALDRMQLSEGLNIYVPRAERSLKKHRNYFEANHMLENWQQVLDRLPALYAATREALTVLDGLEKYRKSIGYSFGREYLYEDALEAQKMRQAFAKYMLAAYYQDIDAVRVYAARAHEELKNVNRSIARWAAMNAMRRIWSFGLLLSNFIQRMAENGVPSEEDLKAFRNKTAYAKSLDV